jgi:serine/threonine protein kinase
VSTGASLGPYRIEDKLGEGGMGEVFRAVDTRLGRAVAIKTTREEFGSRFEREARAISSLSHPNICTLYDMGPNYLVMELVEGKTIAALLKSGPLPLKTALLYASQIAAALAEAHAKGNYSSRYTDPKVAVTLTTPETRIIRCAAAAFLFRVRGLKPGNIMIAKSGVKVLDFGLAKRGTDETVTSSHMVIGTSAYMAPEQREGKPAGCALRHLLVRLRSLRDVDWRTSHGSAKAHPVAKTGKDRQPVSRRRPCAPPAIGCRVAAGTG